MRSCERDVSCWVLEQNRRKALWIWLLFSLAYSSIEFSLDRFYTWSCLTFISNTVVRDNPEVYLDFDNI